MIKNILNKIAHKIPFLKNLTYTHWFWIIVSFITLLRIFIIGKFGLDGDESYYWIWSRNLSLSYYDHPPMVAYIIYVSTFIFGNSEFAVRFPTIITWFFIFIMTFYLTKKLFGEKSAFWSIVSSFLVPLFMINNLDIRPEIPFTFFWMLFIFIFWKIIETSNSKYWYLIGIILGFGLLSKYTAILLIPSVLLFLIISHKHRFWFFKKEPYIALIIAFIVFSPVIFWNIENNFASFGYQFNRVITKSHYEGLNILIRLFIAPLKQFQIIGFIIFIYWAVLFWSIYEYFRENRDSLLLIFTFSFPILLFFDIIGLHNWILPYWLTSGYLVLSLGVGELTQLGWRNKWLRIYSYLSWGLGFITVFLLLINIFYKVIPDKTFYSKFETFKQLKDIYKIKISDHSDNYYGRKEIANKVYDFTKHKEKGIIIFSNDYGEASRLSFYLPGNPEVYCLNDVIDTYDFWQRNLASLNGKDSIFVTNAMNFTEPTKVYPFESWEKPEMVEIYREGRKIEIFYLYYGKNFQLEKLDPKYTSAILGPKLTLKEGLIRLWNRIINIIKK
ncbi:MAG: glycosyltransferase family 39 protein [Elusimicrobia bacterium]|nr:glycosyltransferase family 39 protein [Elusimicrobiota bacterium]